MRTASRIVGVVLVLAGTGFVALPGYVFAIGQWSSGAAIWILCAFLVAAGIGYLLAGRYFLRLDVDEPDEVEHQPASRFAPYLLAHRRELKFTAQAGLAISLIRLAAACFGRDWPGRWLAWPLVLAWIGLVVATSRIAKPRTMNLDWQTVPERMRPALNATLNLGRAALLILAMLFAWSQWFHHRVGAQLVQAPVITLIFAWESLFFSYGELRTDREASVASRWTTTVGNGTTDRAVLIPLAAVHSAGSRTR
jgi:hypothetical protein